MPQMQYPGPEEEVGASECGRELGESKQKQGGASSPCKIWQTGNSAVLAKTTYKELYSECIQPGSCFQTDHCDITELLFS